MNHGGMCAGDIYTTFEERSLRAFGIPRAVLTSSDVPYVEREPFVRVSLLEVIDDLQMHREYLSG